MFHKHGVPRSRIDFLRSVPTFEGLPDKALSRIDAHLDDLKVQAGRVLTHQGEAAEEVFIVAEGEAEVRIGDEVVGTTGVGEMIGELGVLQHTPRSATVTASTPMRLLVINPREMQWLFDDERLAARVQENVARHTGTPG